MGGEPRSHPVSARGPIHAGFLSGFSGNVKEELALKPSVLKPSHIFYHTQAEDCCGLESS